MSWCLYQDEGVMVCLQVEYIEEMFINPDGGGAGCDGVDLRCVCVYVCVCMYV